MKEPVVIIGAGPAGLSCADELAREGLEIVLIDDNPIAGGQYFRQLPPGYRVGPHAELLRDRARFDRLAQVLALPNVRYLSSTLVWGAPGRLTVAYAGPQESGRIRASAIVIATGAQERSLPFRGWTLPGVISAGGCLNLAKGHGLVPSGRVVVAGNGPLVLVAAATLLAAKANVVAVVEAQSDLRLGKAFLRGLVDAPVILTKGLGYRARILGSGIPFRTGAVVSQAEGAGALEAVSIAPIDPAGRVGHERARRIDADTLVTGYGLLPGTEAARLFGCRTGDDAALNGIVPLRDSELRTSVEGVYAIGDGAGIGGVDVAIAEGRVAAHSILSKAPPPSFAAHYRRIDRYRRVVNLAYRLPAPPVAATNDTIICRCEELTLGRLRDSALHGISLNAVKTATRLGMGRCQGRNCLHAAAAMLEFDQKETPQIPRVRPPLKPVPAGRLAADADAARTREPDEPDHLETAG